MLNIHPTSKELHAKKRKKRQKVWQKVSYKHRAIECHTLALHRYMYVHTAMFGRLTKLIKANIILSSFISKLPLSTNLQQCMLVLSNAARRARSSLIVNKHKINT